MGRFGGVRMGQKVTAVTKTFSVPKEQHTQKSGTALKHITNCIEKQCIGPLKRLLKTSKGSSNII